MNKEGTITAISTPYGTGGISIIRLSGEKAFCIAERIFKGKVKVVEMKTHTINYGKIIIPQQKKVLDYVLLLKMNAPKTYTGEDTIEINCHGGPLVTQKILEVLLNEGARLANPGEFTERAFLNGKMDLSQAEAIVDLINAKTQRSIKAAINQLEGKFSKKINKIREKLVQILAHIEVTLDYPEHDIEEITGEQVIKTAKRIKKEILRLSESYFTGRIIKEGINIVITGKANVGKSSLMNELAGRNKAIVTDVPGTTRDIITESINIKGIPVNIVDTAGIRKTKDKVEVIGVNKAKKEIDKADLVIMIVDGSEELDKEDIYIFDKIKKHKHILLVNKTDKADLKRLEKTYQKFKKETEAVIKTSMKKKTGIDELIKNITNMFLVGEVSIDNEYIVTSERHKNLLDKAIENIDNAIGSYEEKMPLDCIAIDVKEALLKIGKITGDAIEEEVKKEIFSKFCIGK